MLTVDNRTLKMASESIFIHIQFISEQQTQFPDGKTMFLVTIRSGLLSQDMNTEGQDLASVDYNSFHPCSAPSMRNSVYMELQLPF